jgi:4-aminobutyrate aminotransferase/(S)-3-amino-2-methylpropionate transaminase
LAIELFTGPDHRTPDPGLAKELVALAAKRGLILLSCGMYGNTIRFLGPITASDELVNEGLDIVEGCLETLTSA